MKATNVCNYRKGSFETRVPKKIAEAMGLIEGCQNIEWSISKNGVVTVKKVEEGK